jgi:hypothetical protein
LTWTRRRPGLGELDRLDDRRDAAGDLERDAGRAADITVPLGAMKNWWRPCPRIGRDQRPLMLADLR